MIIFENINTGETVGIDRQTGGAYYQAKLSAVMNSSDMSVNADRGQDFGWRLQAEQRALIEQWEEDPDMIDKVSVFTKVPIDGLSHSEFLAYFLHQQELGKSPEKTETASKRANQLDYAARVEAVKQAQADKQPMPAFNPAIARGDATVEDFLNGDVTGDASGDKVEPAPLTPQQKAAATRKANAKASEK